MSAAVVIRAIRTIISIVQEVRRLQDLNANGATSAITINDLNEVVSGANAQFFADVAIGDIRMIDNRFRNVWLPTILGYARRFNRDISQGDLQNPSGALWATFSGLENGVGNLDVNLNRLRVVFERHHSRLHIDELVRGFFACLNGYGLLLHMHAVRTELRRIQIGATTLEDSRLVDYTRFALQYILDGVELLDGFLEPIWNRRRSLIGPLRELWNPNLGGSMWVFDDDYTPLRSTTPELTLAFSRFTPGDTNAQRAERARQEYIGRARDRVSVVVRSRHSEIRPQFMGLWNAMRERERRQSGTRAVIRRRHPPPRGFRPSGRAVVFSELGTTEDGLGGEVKDGIELNADEDLEEGEEEGDFGQFLAVPLPGDHALGPEDANPLDLEDVTLVTAPKHPSPESTSQEDAPTSYALDPPAFGVDHDVVVNWPGYSLPQTISVA